MRKGQTCGTCIHFHSSDGKGGQCREGPPQVIAIAAGAQKQPVGNPQTPGGILMVEVPKVQVQAVFPLMTANDPGCGRHDDGNEEE